MNKLHLIFLLVGGTITGCGIYSFTGATLPPHIKTIGVVLFEDQTTEYGLDQQVTDRLIKALREDNTLRIANPKEADAVLSGTILRVEDRAGQYDAQEMASDFRVYVTVKVRMEDMQKKRLMWETSLTQWGTYDGREIPRTDGLSEAIDHLVTEILNKTLSDW